MPALTDVAEAAERIFSEDDFSFDQKMQRLRRSIGHHLGPIWTDVKRSIDQANLDDALARAVEEATPKMADAAARAAPRAALAFGNAWLDMGPWGRLLTLGLLAGKLGVFSVLGRRASNRFADAFRTQSKTSMVAPARTASATAATTFAGSVGPSLNDPKRKARATGAFRGFGKGLGRSLGLGVLSGFVLFLPELIAAGRRAIEELGGDLDYYTTPKGWLDQLGDLKNYLGEGLSGQLPKLGLDSLGPGAATGGIVTSRGNLLVGERGPEVLTLPKAARIDPLPQVGSVLTAHDDRPIVVQTVLDGRVVAESVARRAQLAANRR